MLKTMKISLPRLSTDLETLEDLRTLMESDETISTAFLHHEDITSAIARGFTANDVRLDRVNATQAKLEMSNLSDVEIMNCDLIAATMPESSWRRLLFKDSRCSGLQIQSSQLKDITFISCKMNLTNFRFSKLINVQFRDCILDEADFYSTELTDVSFQNCSMDRTVFSSSKLKHVDFRTSTINNISGIRSISGSTIDSAQLISIAPLLAHELKIIVKND